MTNHAGPSGAYWYIFHDSTRNSFELFRIMINRSLTLKFQLEKQLVNDVPNEQDRILPFKGQLSRKWRHTAPCWRVLSTQVWVMKQPRAASHHN